MYVAQNHPNWVWMILCKNMQRLCERLCPLSICIKSHTPATVSVNVHPNSSDALFSSSSGDLRIHNICPTPSLPGFLLWSTNMCSTSTGGEKLWSSLLLYMRCQALQKQKRINGLNCLQKSRLCQANKRLPLGEKKKRTGLYRLEGVPCKQNQTLKQETKNIS